MQASSPQLQAVTKNQHMILEPQISSDMALTMFSIKHDYSPLQPQTDVAVLCQYWCCSAMPVLILQCYVSTLASYMYITTTTSAWLTFPKGLLLSLLTQEKLVPKLCKSFPDSLKLKICGTFFEMPLFQSCIIWLGFCKSIQMLYIMPKRAN